MPRTTGDEGADAPGMLALPPELYDTPAAQRARLLGVLEAKQAALQSATWLLGWGRPLLVVVIAVSFLHAWESVAAIRPAFVGPLLLPVAVYHLAAAAFTLAIDLVALYVVAVGQAVMLAGMRVARWAGSFFLGVTLLLNAAFVVRHAPSLPAAWQAVLLPGLEASFVVLLPAFVMLAILAVERATHQLVQARLTLLAETRALAEIVATTGDPSAGETIRLAPALPTDPPPAAATSTTGALQSAALPCPRCGTALTMGQYLAARRDDGCPTCRPIDTSGSLGTQG